MSELMVELRADAFPARNLSAAVVVLKDGLARELRAAGLAPRQAATGFTGRRIVILMRGITRSRELQEESRFGAANAVQRWLTDFAWPGAAAAGQIRFRNSLRSLVALLDGEALRVRVHGLAAGLETIGHPVLSPEPFSVQGIEQYRRELYARGIEVRFAERRARLRELLLEAAGRAGGELVEDAALLDEVAAGIELPGVLAVPLDGVRDDLPRELVVIALRERLRAFSLQRAGRPVPSMLVAIDRPDDPDRQAARGHAWAAAALLRDLGFYWDRDRQVPLAELARRVSDRVWRPGLGSYAQRNERLTGLLRWLCAEIGWEGETDRALEVAQLLHADAATALARRMPELRGVIGGVLARDEGYPDAVWQALHDHRRPATGHSVMPRGRCGTLVVLAHWLDQIAALAVARANGDLDPDLAGDGGAAATGVVRVALSRGLPLDLRLVAAQAIRQFRAQGFGGDLLAPEMGRDLEHALRRLLLEDRYAEAEIAAVVSAPGSSRLDSVQARLRDLRDLRRRDAASSRLAVLSRTARTLSEVLRETGDEELHVRLLAEEAEKDLFVALQAANRAGQQPAAMRAGGAWVDAMQRLDVAVHRFLREVLVHDQDPGLRRNRLALLQGVARLYEHPIRWAELTPTGLEGQPQAPVSVEGVS